MIQALQDQLVQEWARSRGLGNRAIRRLPNLGFVNDVYAIGDDLILRVNKPDVEDQDAYTEAVAVPIARAAGIKTPELLEFDRSKTILPTVATLYRRAPGHTLGQQRVDQDELPSLYREIGMEMATLHVNVVECADPHGWLDQEEKFEARELLGKARENQKVEAVSFDWISRWLDRLEPALVQPLEKVFLHNDLHSFNVLVHLDPLRLSAILDWGDAAWGDPMVEFGTMPIWAVEWLLEGYEPIAGPVDQGFFGRLIWHCIGAALDATIDPWVETSEPWQPLTTSRWINLIRLLSEQRDPRWQPWLP